MNEVLRPFLGTTNGVKKAFPDVLELNLIVSQDEYGYYTLNQWQRSNTFTLGSLRPHLCCLNPKCQQGGLDLQNIISNWKDGSHSFPCNGHEGTPKGRRIGAPCENVFHVTMRTKRK